MRNRRFAVLFIIFFVLTFVGLMCFMGIINLSGSKTTPEGPTTDDPTTEGPTTDDPTTDDSTTEGPTTEKSNNGPVSLFDCYTTTNDWDNYIEIKYDIKDNMGDRHEKSYTIDDYDNNNTQKSITVKLDKKYTRLEVPSMYILEDSKNTKSEYVLVFKNSDSGKELGASPMLTTGSKAVSYEIDVTGVEFLEISKEIMGYGPWHDCVVGLDEAYLYID